MAGVANEKMERSFEIKKYGEAGTIEEIMKKLYNKAGIVKEGHFILTSGRHSNLYINKDSIYSSFYFRHTIMEIVEICKSFDFDIITGPAIAGAVLAAPICFELIQVFKEVIKFVYPEKIENKMVFRRGYDKVILAKKVLIIEDIITTGSNVEKTIEAVEKCGGAVVGVICIWNRSGFALPESMKIPVLSLINEKVESWESDVCPYCKDNIPLTNPKTGEVIS